MSATEPSPLLSVRPKRKTRFFLENAITKARRAASPLRDALTLARFSLRR